MFMYRFEDRGLTLRLFRDERDVELSGSNTATQYGAGFIAKNRAGRWMDAHGPLPLDWAPAAEHLAPEPKLKLAEQQR